MAELSARFSIVDEMSDKLEQMASAGEAMAASLENAGESSSAAFDGISDGISDAVSAVNDMEDAVGGYNGAASDAAGATGYWSDAVNDFCKSYGDYTKELLESQYTTEELVKLGYKTAEALDEERSVAELCEMATSDLKDAVSDAAGAHTELSDAMTAAADAAQKAADNDKISEEAKKALQEATNDAAEAFDALEEAQKDAKAAMDAYDAVAKSGEASTRDLEDAALRAADAADKLAAANKDAKDATKNLTDATDDAGKAADDAGNKSVDAINNLSSALASAGITKALKEIVDTVYELVDAFSEAESTVVTATGATGDALNDLTDSMMSVYAASKTGTLNETAAAVGEINTRLGYTGDELEDTTAMFLDFAAVTGGSASNSVRSVTQLMNQWNIDASDMETVLSKLTVAGQESGISVDTLSSQLTTNKAVLDQIGFSLDDAIALFEKMELAGTQTSSVMMGFRTALSSGAISSLDDLNTILEQAKDGLLTTTDAASIFGSRAGVAIVNAAQTGVFELDDMVGSLEDASGTLDTTATAAQTLDQKWSQATNNIGAAFTSVLEPGISAVSSGLADFVNKIGTFLGEHPTVVKALTAIGTVIGVVAAAFAALSAAAVAYNAVIAISQAVTTAFGVSLSAILGPIALVAAAIGAVVTIVSTFNERADESTDVLDDWTETTKQQEKALQDLSDEYDAAVDKYGALSDEASTLKYQLDDATAAFESSKKTIGEFEDEVDDLCDSAHELSTSYTTAIDDISGTEIDDFALIQKFTDLREKASLTKDEEVELASITATLSEKYPDLADALSDTTSNAEDLKDALDALAEKESNQNKYDTAVETYEDALETKSQLEDQIEAAKEDLAAAKVARNNAEIDYYEKNPTAASFPSSDNGLESDSAYAKAASAVNEYQHALDDLEGAQVENNVLIDDTAQEIYDLTYATRDAAVATGDYGEVAEAEFSAISEKLQEAEDAYNSTYEAAMTSFQNQFDLFDQAEIHSKKYCDDMVADAQEALDSQLAYWENYSGNLSQVVEYVGGLAEDEQEKYSELISYISTGTDDAAAMAQGMADAIQSGDTTAIDDLASTMTEISTVQNEAADTTAEWTSNLEEVAQECADELAGIVEDDMNLADEADASASATMDSYTAALKSKGAAAVAAAQSIANQINSALSSTSSFSVSTAWTHNGTVASIESDATGTLSSAGAFIAGEEGKELVVPAHAAGSLEGEDYYIAGEHGPELIVGEQGSEVFPASETDRLISALNDMEREKSANGGGHFTYLTYGAPAYNTYEGDDTYNTYEGDDLSRRYESETTAATYEGDALYNTYEGDTIYNTIADDISQGAEVDFTTPQTVSIPQTAQTVGEERESGGEKESVKRVLLEVAGSGAIDIKGSGVSKEKVVDILYTYLKPVLTDIVQQEIFEEGDYSYAY